MKWIFEIITVAIVVAAVLFFWLRSKRKANQLPPAPLWFTHLAQRLGMLAEYKDKKTRWEGVLKGQQNGFSFNIGGLPTHQPLDLYVSVKTKNPLRPAWEIHPKGGDKAISPDKTFVPQPFIDGTVDAHLVCFAPQPLILTPEQTAILATFFRYPSTQWMLGTHRDTIYYKEPFEVQAQGNQRVDHLCRVLELLLSLAATD